MGSRKEPTDREIWDWLSRKLGSISITREDGCVSNVEFSKAGVIWAMRMEAPNGK